MSPETGRITPSPAAALTIAALPSACTASSLGMPVDEARGAWNSSKPFHTPEMMLPSPTGTTTRSGTCQPSCSQISNETVFLPSRV